MHGRRWAVPRVQSSVLRGLPRDPAIPLLWAAAPTPTRLQAGSPMAGGLGR